MFSKDRVAGVVSGQSSTLWQFALLADSNRTSMTNTYLLRVYSVEILLMMDRGPVRNM